MSKRPEIVLADLSKPKHQQDVLTLHLAAQAEGLPRHAASDEPSACEARQKARLITDLQARDNTRIWLAYDGETPVGMAHCHTQYSTWWCADELYIQDLFVVEDRRGEGIGKDLVDEGIRYARAEGFCRVSLTTTANNLGAGRLYSRMGFSCSESVADGLLEKALTAANRQPGSYAVLQKYQIAEEQPSGEG